MFLSWLSNDYRGNRNDVLLCTYIMRPLLMSTNWPFWHVVGVVGVLPVKQPERQLQDLPSPQVTLSSHTGAGRSLGDGSVRQSIRVYPICRHAESADACVNSFAHTYVPPFALNENLQDP